MEKANNPTFLEFLTILLLALGIVVMFVDTVTQLSYYDYSGAEFAVVHVEKLRFSLTYPTKWRAIVAEKGYRGIRNMHLVIDKFWNEEFAITVSQELLRNPTSEQIIEMVESPSRSSCKVKGTPTTTTVDGYPAYVIFYSCGQSETEDVYILRQNDVLNIGLTLNTPQNMTPSTLVQYREGFHKIVQSIDIWD